jgi:ribonuclease P protein component
MTRAAPHRLKRRREFLRVQAAGRKAAMPGLVLQAAARDDNGLGVGFTASKRVGNAVTRNRARRRLRAAAAEILPLGAVTGHDYVIIGRAGSVDRPYDALRRDLVAALKRLKLWTVASPVATRQESS